MHLFTLVFKSPCFHIAVQMYLISDLPPFSLSRPTYLPTLFPRNLLPQVTPTPDHLLTYPPTKHTLSSHLLN